MVNRSTYLVGQIPYTGGTKGPVSPAGVSTQTWTWAVAATYILEDLSIKPDVVPSIRHDLALMGAHFS
jgi:hypothetical protein